MTDSFQRQLQTSLGSAYTLGRELGGGGMSRVFVARDETLGRDVVVKVLAPHLAEGLSAERFAREIRLAAALQEPHIVPVHAAGTTGDGLPYYTMPFVAGESLRARLANGRLPIAETIAILRDVATALEHAHARGIVHRDVKPENILLSGRTAVVTDFGIAKALEASKTHAAGATLTQAGMSIGTPAYMAPNRRSATSSTHAPISTRGESWRTKRSRGAIPSRARRPLRRSSPHTSWTFQRRSPRSVLIFRRTSRRSSCAAWRRIRRLSLVTVVRRGSDLAGRGTSARLRTSPAGRR